MKTHAFLTEFSGGLLPPLPDPLLHRMAWWLRQRTTVGRQWVCERLCMGEVSAVNRSIGLVEVGRDRPLERMKRTLENLPYAKA